MASLRDIRKRIKSVKNTQKITKAMKMVSAAKLRRAQEAVEASRPYADKVDNTVSALAARAAALGEAPHPLLSSGLKAQGRIEVIVLTSDRGLCGGFNSNTVRRAQRFQIDESPKHAAIEFATIGKKGNELLKARKVEIKANYPDVTKEGFTGARKLAETYCERFMDEDDQLDGVYLLYNKFKGDLTLKQLLPVIMRYTQLKMDNVHLLRFAGMFLLLTASVLPPTVLTSTRNCPAPSCTLTPPTPLEDRVFLPPKTLVLT